MKNILILFISSLLFIGCSNMKVSVDYDDSFDMSNEKTFVVVHKSAEGDNTLTDDRIINALERELVLKNYEKVSEQEADLIFSFQLGVENKSELQPSYEVGFGRYGRRGGGMVSTSSTYSYKEGTLIIDALKDEKVVWRGTAVMELKDKKTPQKRTEYINEIVTKLMSSFPR